MRHENLKPVPAKVLGPMTGLDWLNHFERFARDLEARSIARTGYPLPKSEGFSAPANHGDGK